MDATVRCAGCGKEINPGLKSVRIATGKIAEGEFAESREWGVMHEDCFDRSIESPASALAKIKKLAKPTVLISAGKKSKIA